MVEELTFAIVIDNGSAICQAGKSGQEEPSSSFPSIVGREKTVLDLKGMDSKQVYFGEYAQQKRGILNLRQPVEQGVVTNWEDMEQLWNYCFKEELRVSPEDQPCLLTQNPFNSKENKEKTTQIMFETFNCPAFYIAVQSILSLYANGITTGIVLESGEGITYTVPVYEGNYLPHAVKKIDLGGRDLTNYLAKLIQECGISFTGAAQMEVVRKIKEKCCYIALNRDEEYNKGVTDVSYELPDGQQISVGNQRFRCPESLFKPNLIGQDSAPIHELIYTSIMNCDVDIRRQLLNSIVLAGGNTMFEGIQQRLEKELQSLVPAQMQFKVKAPVARNQTAWIGGSILSCMSSFEQSWISKHEYDEEGAQIVHKKCF